MTLELVDMGPGIVIEADDDYSQGIEICDDTVKMTGDKALPNTGGLLLPGGLCQRVSTNDGEASATFTLVTRQKETNLHGNRHQIGKNKHGQGLRLDYYANNPTVLFDHQMNPHYTLPIGISRDAGGKLRVKGSANQAQGTVFYDQGSPTAMDIGRMTSAGIFNMASIGFKAIRGIWSPAQASEAQGADKINVANLGPGAYGGWDFVETLLYEWSIVTFGADQGAIRQALEQRKVMGEKLQAITMTLIQPYAEPKPVIGIGMDLSKGAMTPAEVRQSASPQEQQAQQSTEADGVTIEQRLAAIEQQVATMAAGAVAQEVQAVQPVTYDAQTGEPTRHEQPQMDEGRIIQAVVSRAVLAVVPALKQMADEQTKLRAELRYARDGV